jgi:CubicO group peptidase (beta-lactamase class C family)
MRRSRFSAGATSLTAGVLLCRVFSPISAPGQVFPAATWEFKTPAEVGMDSAKLDVFRDYVGGRGCVVRHGCMTYTWGDQALRADVASACKPWFSTFLFMAVEDGRLASVDDLVVNWEPCLNNINFSLGYKDRNITFRHMANQISCYGVRENPGAAFDYNDWQMALFWDTLFLRIYGATYSNVDATVLHPLLTDILQCQDNPTMMIFGTGDRMGRVGVSVRDFARFGLLFLNKGNWNGTQIISQAHATMAVTSPLPNSISRTTAIAAEMCSGQRTIGSGDIPDNQGDHNGSYSWAWWTNGIDRTGQRRYPDCPLDMYMARGHHGPRLMVVIPSLDLVISWNDANPSSDPMINEAIHLVVAAVLPDRPYILLNPGSIEQTVEYTQSPLDETLTVTNSGIGELDYMVQADQPWLTVTPSSGSSTGEADAITVHYLASGLSIGTYVASIQVTDNGSSPPAGNSPQNISVTLHVVSVLPDLDEDGDVDQEDFGEFQACLSGQDTPPPSCLGADFNHNGLVDQLDFAVFLGCLSGPNVMADRTCDDLYE